MPTECIQDSFAFGRVEGGAVVADFGGGTITSDAGALLLWKTDSAVRLIDRFAACFRDHRSPQLIEHTARTLVGQRVLGIALGHEDLVDHDRFRHDPVMAAILGKLTPRRKECAPLAGKSTLSRLEHAPAEGSAYAPWSYHKIEHDAVAIERLFVEVCLDAHKKPPPVMVLDLDVTATRKSASSTATTTATAICRCSSSRAAICSQRSCAHRISTRRRAASKSAASAARI